MIFILYHPNTTQLKLASKIRTTIIAIADLIPMHTHAKAIAGFDEPGASDYLEPAFAALSMIARAVRKGALHHGGRCY